MSPNQIVLNDFVTKHPFAAAQSLEKLEPEDMADFIQTLPIEKSAKLLALMNTKKAAECFVILPPQNIKALIEHMEPTVIASLLRLTDKSLHKTLLAKISANKLATIRRIMKFVPNTVGAIMQPALTANKELTVKDAVELIKHNNENAEFDLYIVDIKGVFLGVVEINKLLLSDQTNTLEELMIASITKFSPDVPVKSIIDHPSWIDHRYIPVVDESEKLLGSLHYKTIKEMSHKSSNTSTNEIMETGGALGELYLIGLTGLIHSVGK